MFFGFSAPQVLAGLLLLPLIIYVERRAWSALAPWRRRTVLACRLLEVLCLVLALSGLRWERARQEICVLFAIDASRSVSESERDAALEKIAAAADTMRPGDSAGIIVFGRQPLIDSVPQARISPDHLLSQPDPNYTDIAAMMRLASGIYPEGLRRRLVVFSDGNENRGNALEALRTAQAAGISIDVFPIETPQRKDVSLIRMDVPSRVERDEPFVMRVEAISSHPTEATLRVFRDGAPLGRRQIGLLEGSNLIQMTMSEDQPGFHTYEAIIESPDDMQPENNLAGAFTQVSGPSRVLIVGGDEDGRALSAALDLSRLDHENSPVLPNSLAQMQPYDAIYLNNVSAVEFSGAQLERLERFVQDLGGGLGMIGGENSFAPGGWIGTPVEKALPVRMELSSKEKFPSLALAIIIDKSGSMGGQGGGVSKMEMANHATIEAVKLLGPRDEVGVVAFDSAAKWVVRLGPATNLAQITRQVSSIVSGGGTNAYMGALIAYEAMVQSEAKLKHMILLTDGHTPEADFDDLSRKMNEAGITLSTIAIGSDADQSFLEWLAADGRGRFYYCPDPSRIPRVFVRETILVQRSYIMEETLQPSVGASHPILSDAQIQSTPALHGWVVTEIKDRAEPVMMMKEDPLLAVWNYGLGKSVAFTSDAKAQWGRDWTAWSGFQPFWDRVMRWSLRSVPSHELHPTIEFSRGQGKLRIEAVTASGERLNFLNLRARVVFPDLTVEEFPLRQTAIGSYELDFEAEDPGAYLTGIFDDQGRQVSGGGLVAYSPEFKDFRSNEYLLYELARQTGGKVRPKLDEIFRREGEPVRAAKEVTPALLIVALIVLLIEVAVRRLYFDEEQIEKARRIFGSVIPRRRLAPAGGPPAEDLGLPSELKMRSREVRSSLQMPAPSEETLRELGGKSSAPAEGGATEAAPATGSDRRDPPERKPRTGAASPADAISQLRKMRAKAAPDSAAAESSPARKVFVSSRPASAKQEKPAASRREPAPASDSDRDPSPPTEESEKSSTMERLLERKRKRK